MTLNRILSFLLIYIQVVVFSKLWLFCLCENVWIRQPLSQWFLQKGKGNSAHDNSICYLITVFIVQKFQGVLSLWNHKSEAIILNPQHQHTQCLKVLSVTNPQSHFWTPNPVVHTLTIDQNNLGIKNYKKIKASQFVGLTPQNYFIGTVCKSVRLNTTAGTTHSKTISFFYNHFFSPLAH